MTLVGGILIILGVSLASTNYMIDTELPTRIFAVIREHIDNKLTFLLALNVFLLVLGTMLDVFSALVIMIPIILPIALDYGVNPLHLGIIFLANMQLGLFHAAGGHESVYRQLSLRQTHRRTVHRHVGRFSCYC